MITPSARAFGAIFHVNAACSVSVASGSSFIQSSSNLPMYSFGRAAIKPVLMAFCSSWPPKSDNVTNNAPASSFARTSSRGSFNNTVEASRNKHPYPACTSVYTTCTLRHVQTMRSALPKSPFASSRPAEMLPSVFMCSPNTSIMSVSKKHITPVSTHSLSVPLSVTMTVNASTTPGAFLRAESMSSFATGQYAEFAYVTTRI
mmetsp:Transcript_5167/g.18808  ORF Transcript_5167/g.18808 Transcript_5167/m.18808 type:complete len:203 (-) Transcript_5167:1152-1760(-)